MGLNNYLSVNGSIPRGTNTINYLFVTSENNTVTQICYTTIIFCYLCTTQTFLDYVNVNFSIISNYSNSPVNFRHPIFNPNAPDWNQNNCMFFGMSEFNLSRANYRYFDLSTIPNSNYAGNYSSNYGTY